MRYSCGVRYVMAGRSGMGVLLFLWMACVPAAAEMPEATGALRSAADRGPLELARAVHARGDSWVMASLQPERSVATRVAAARAAPWMRAPEQALVPLAELAGGRDAALAEAAAIGLRRIAARLDALALARREARPAALADAWRALTDVERDTTARSDARVAAGLVAGVLKQGGVDAP